MKICPFCTISADTKLANILHETQQFLCFSPLTQESVGHTLIVSKVHYSNLLEAPSSIGAELIEVCQSLAQHFHSALGATGFNLLCASGADAQQSVMHLHFHYLPRYVNDGINAWPDLQRKNSMT